MHRLVKLWVYAVAAPVILYGCTTNRSNETDIVLVRAQAYTPSVKYTGTYPADWDKDLPPGMESIPVGGYFVGRFHVEDTLGGMLNREGLTIKFTMADMFVHMPDMFMVLKLNPDGTALALWWDFAKHGLCLNQKNLEQIHLTKEGAAAEQKYPCKLKDN